MQGVFNRGIPWETDVQRIEAKFPSLADGLVILAKDIEECINEPRTKSRFQGVTGAWRRKVEREKNILITKRNGSFIVLDNSGKVKVSASGYCAGVRKIYKSGRRAARTGANGLTPEERRVRDHVAITAANIASIASTAAKDIAWPDPIKRIEH